MTNPNCMYAELGIVIREDFLYNITAGGACDEAVKKYFEKGLEFM